MLLLADSLGLYITSAYRMVTVLAHQRHTFTYNLYLTKRRIVHDGVKLWYSVCLFTFSRMPNTITIVILILRALQNSPPPSSDVAPYLPSTPALLLLASRRTTR